MSAFTRTQSVAQFASVQGITNLEIKKNPKTGKFFGVDSKGDTYRIAEALGGVLTMECQVSWFTPEDGGEASYMIHPRGEGAPTVSALSFAPQRVNAENAI
jgi:hypothetical protein